MLRHSQFLGEVSATGGFRSIDILLGTKEDTMNGPIQFLEPGQGLNKQTWPFIHGHAADKQYHPCLIRADASAQVGGRSVNPRRIDAAGQLVNAVARIARCRVQFLGGKMAVGKSVIGEPDISPKLMSSVDTCSVAFFPEVKRSEAVIGEKDARFRSCQARHEVQQIIAATEFDKAAIGFQQIITISGMVPKTGGSVASGMTDEGIMQVACLLDKEARVPAPRTPCVEFTSDLPAHCVAAAGAMCQEGSTHRASFPVQGSP